MDLRQLSYLVAVGDEGGIRAAARRLHISQPQVSQALRRLERELGVELMLRSARGIELTPEGDELVAHGREILERVGAARTALKRMAADQDQSSTLRVGVVAGALSAGELLAPILDAYRRLRPDVTVRLEDLTFGGQPTGVLAGAVDVGIVRAPLSHPELVLTPIAQEPRVIMVGAAHELAGEAVVDVDDVLGFPTLPLESPTEWADFWQLNDVRGGPNCASDVAPVRSVPEAQLAVATHDVLVTSPAALGRLAPNPLTRAIPLTGASATVIAVAHRRRDRRRIVIEFVELAQATAERHIDLLPGGAIPIRPW